LVPYHKELKVKPERSCENAGSRTPELVCMIIERLATHLIGIGERGE
jgi:hypothetical protein